MFGLFQPRPPLSTSQRVDMEWLMRRTRDLIGESAFSKRDVVRGVEAFQWTAFDRGVDDVALREIVQQLSPRFQFSGHEFQKIQWDVSADQQEPFVYDSANAKRDDASAAVRVTIARWAMEDKLQAVMVVASALSRHVWEHHRQRDLDVQPQTTSLLPIIVGLGILASESALLDRQWSTAGWSGWSLNRFGHYNAMEIGYAMALLERGAASSDATPAWLPKLRLDSRVIWKQATGYFRKMDQEGRPLIFDAPVIPGLHSTDVQLAGWIAGDDTSFAYAAAVIATKKRLSSTAIIDAALAASQQKDPDVVYRSIEVLRNADANRDDVRQQLTRLSSSKSLQVAFAAAQSATACGIPHAKLIQTAKRLLAAESFDLLPVLVWIEGGGNSMSALLPTLQQHLVDANRFQHDQAVRAIERCINKIQS